ncbi:putative RNA methyltransferase [Dietzia sp. CH92]|uniref:putative RNA methyltransferase n=1 Tax=Dietzia sp. CH92 TaxID=3051823 RepID=UPI0028D290B6|nr:methyltransferase type 11 [Dietzia sp. CH92]
MSAGPAALPSALERVVPLLRCPLCREGLRPADAGPDGAVARAVVCGAGHSFDRARHGYLSLFGPRGRRFPGDTADQVAARDRVLGSGLFDGVVGVLAEVAREAVADGGPAVGSRPWPGPVVLEAGAGTGHYLAGVLDALAGIATATATATGAGIATATATATGAATGAETRGTGGVLGIGTEISAAAARRLARAHPDAAALVADTWEGLPLADGIADLVQVVFAPRNAAEFARVLRPGGTLAVVVPGEGHLEPLRTAGGMLAPAPDKVARLDSELGGAFEPGPVRVVDRHHEVPATVAVDLALMGPSGVHLDRARLEHTLGPGDRPVRVHLEVHTYRRPR